MGLGSGTAQPTYAFLGDHSLPAVGYGVGHGEDAVRLTAALNPALADRGVPAGVYVDTGSALGPHRGWCRSRRRAAGAQPAVHHVGGDRTPSLPGQEQRCALPAERHDCISRELSALDPSLCPKRGRGGGAMACRCFAARLWIPSTRIMRHLSARWKSRPGTGHSPQNETEIQLPDQEKLADAVDTDILRTRQDLAIIIRAAAHHALAAIQDRAEGAWTGQLADLAYAFACLEGARPGVLPGTPPPPKTSAPAGVPPRLPASSPQPGPGLPRRGDTNR